MKKRKEHPLEVRRLCINKWKKGMSNAGIAELVELPVTTVKGIITRFKRHGHCANSRRTGRLRITKSVTDRSIVRKVERNRFICAAALAATVSKDLGVKVRPQVICNRIKEAGLNGRSARKKSYLREDQKRKRLAYAKKLLSKFTQQKERENVLYTDEASVQFHGSSGRISVWRRPNEAYEEKGTVSTFKSSRQSLMVRSSVSANGVGMMHFCSESVNGEYCRGLLQEEISITKELLQLPDIVSFVHDGAPVHCAKLTKASVKELGLGDLGHPPSSPDLNPIENSWAVMKQQLHKNPVASIDDLKEKLADI